jgi:hypothetical protein
MSMPEGALFEALGRVRGAESLIEDWIKDILSGRLFGGFVTLTAGAGTLPHVQIWNPSPQHTFLIRGVLISAPVDTATFWGGANNALNTEVGIFPANGTAGGYPLLIGATTQRRPVAEMRVQSIAGSAIPDFPMGRARVNSNAPISLMGFPMLAIVGTGRGFEVGHNGAAGELQCTFFWKELTAGLPVTG